MASWCEKVAKKGLFATNVGLFIFFPKNVDKLLAGAGCGRAVFFVDCGLALVSMTFSYFVLIRQPEFLRSCGT